MTDAKTEARAIAWEVRGAQLHRVLLDEVEARELASRFKGLVTPLVHATAPAAKNAELSRLRKSDEEWGRLHQQVIEERAAALKELAELKRNLAVADKALEAISRETETDHIGDEWATRGAAIARRARETIGARNEQD